MEAEKDATSTLCGSFDVTMNLPNSAQIALHGYVYVSDTPAEINARIDSFVAAADRQKSRCMLETLRATKKGMIAQLENQREWLKGMVEKRDRVAEGGPKLNSQEKLAIGNADGSIATTLKNLEKIDADIAEVDAILKTQG